MLPRRLFLGLCFAAFAVACSRTGQAAEYGAKVPFQKEVPVAFADFALTYVGERHVAGAKYPRGFTVHDFKVTAGSNTQTVSWSSGTGDIGPTPFQVGAKKFQLELSRSDKLGVLKSNEVVISRAP